MNAKEFDTLVSAVRDETKAISGLELLITPDDIKVFYDDTDYEYRVDNYADLEKLITAIRTLNFFKA